MFPHRMSMPLWRPTIDLGGLKSAETRHSLNEQLVDVTFFLRRSSVPVVERQMPRLRLGTPLVL